jgi:hypothetical protein
VSINSAGADIENVYVQANKGIGFGAQDVDSVTMNRAWFRGPVNYSNKDEITPDDPNQLYATHGMVGVRVAEMDLTYVSAWGFTNMGAIFVDSAVNWTRGGTYYNIMNGAAFWGGTVNLEMTNFFMGWRGGMADDQWPVNVGFLSGATVTTKRMYASHGDGFGAFHDSTGTVEHEDPYIYYSQGPGLWMQDGEYLGLEGGYFTGNKMMGITAYDTGFASIQGAYIANTASASFDPYSPDAGDGIQLDGTPADIFDTTLLYNERVGTVINMSEYQTINEYSFSNVSIDGGVTSFGLIAQQLGMPLPLITDGVTRTPHIEENDQGLIDFGGVLDLVGTTNPDPLMPKAQFVADGGLIAVLTPQQEGAQAPEQASFKTLLAATGPKAVGDIDDDGVSDETDNCPTVYNPNQEDADTDGAGDACDDCATDPDKTEPGQCGCGAPDTDSDDDSVADCIDECPHTCGLMMLVDPDGCPMTLGGCCDGTGCTPLMDEASCTGIGGNYLGDGRSCDSDGDGLEDCPAIDDCVDVDGDGLGDPDYAGIACSPDNCPCMDNPGQTDSDTDGVGDACDRCPGADDTNDADTDGWPDACDNCPSDANRDQADSDVDATGDACDSDADGDGVSDDIDNCPDISNGNQDDADTDGAGDACDNCPNDPAKTEPGQCGCGAVDADSDGDWVMDCLDQCPGTPADVDFVEPDGCTSPVGACCVGGLCGLEGPIDESTCTSRGGVYMGDGMSCDDDQDGDGVPDLCDNCPNDFNAAQGDGNGNGVGDVCDDAKPILQTAVSRKTHAAGAGAWDIGVGVGDVESRSAQLGTANPNELLIIATFDIPVALMGGNDVTTDAGTPTVIAGAAANQLEITVTDLPFNTQVNLTFGGVRNYYFSGAQYATDSTLCVRVIVGDYDNLGRTNFIDFAKVKNAGHLIQLVDSVDRARADFDCDGHPDFLDFKEIRNAGLLDRTAPECTTPIGP